MIKYFQKICNNKSVRYRAHINSRTPDKVLLTISHYTQREDNVFHSDHIPTPLIITAEQYKALLNIIKEKGWLCSDTPLGPWEKY